MPVIVSEFNKTPKVNLYTLTNNSGQLSVKIIDWGATIVGLLFADKGKVQRDLVIGFDDLDSYEGKNGHSNPNFGATVGRYANRISNGAFILNGKTYQLNKNDGANTLHGGGAGFNTKMWHIVATSEATNSITLEYVSVDGEEGFPGTLRTLIKFTVTEANELKLDYSAKLEAGQTVQTVLNLTNHSYFNLSGAHSADTVKVNDHLLQILAPEYQDVDGAKIPTGKLLPVAGTARDFTNKTHTVGERANQIGGYDLSYVLQADPTHFRVDPTDPVKLAAEVFSPSSGIKMSFSTAEPAVQLYTGMGIQDGQAPKKDQSTDPAVKLGPYSGLCLEAQRYINAVNHPEWAKQVVLAPGAEYTQHTVYKFEIANGL